MKIILLIVILIAIAVIDARKIKRKRKKRRNGGFPFTRYDEYPRYCSTYDEIIKRSVPPLKMKQESRLLQVFTVIRHGSRVPIESDQCWQGYLDPEADTARWDCGGIEKPQKNNNFQGTCELGQLLREGYSQVRIAGELLHNAYIATKNPVMRLFHGFTSKKDVMLSSSVFSDKGQRTVMSGKSFLKGFFQFSEGIIPKLEMNISKDLLSPYERGCPKLRQLKKDYFASDEYRTTHVKPETKELRRLMREVLQTNVTGLRDCLMTTICSDRTLHPLFQQSRHESSYFNRFIQFETWRRINLYKYRNNLYPKTASAPLWYDILQRMNKPLENENKLDSLLGYTNDAYSNITDTNTSRFVFYSAHDSTLMTLLASLELPIKEWAQYASMFIIEIHEIEFTRQRVFRIIYNGQNLTPLIQGCDRVCDLKILLNKVTSFANSPHLQCSENEEESIAVDVM